MLLRCEYKDRQNQVCVCFISDRVSVSDAIFFVLGSLIYYAGMMLVRKGRTLESGGSVLQF